MEFIAVLLLIAILFLVISLRNQFHERMNNQDEELREIRQQLARQMDRPETIKPVAPVAPPPPSRETSLDATLKTWQPGLKTGQEIPSAHAENVQEKPVPDKTAPEPALQKPVFLPGTPTYSQTSTGTQHTCERSSPGFFERHPDLEKFIGENLISKIGIAVLVLAIAFFVKYAIDNDWINPAGRVGIGLLCGAILIAFAHLTRNNYKAFSSILVGGGLAVFYFTIALAYHQFGLFSQTASFIIMVVITAFAVIISNIYNRQELAIIALVGGFATPFMLSNGNGDYVTLFIYLIVLNLGLLVIAYRKAWRLLNLLAFIFTVILFGTWLFTLDENEAAIAYRNAFIFAAIFYLLFFAINIAHNIKEKKKFIASDFGILLTNTGLYFGTGLFCLTEIYAEEFRGLFCIVMGIFNLGASYFLFRKSKVDGNILYLLIGITLTFISLTAPIQLNGHNITLFWATEAVLLYWLYQKSGIGIIRLSSFIIWVCMLISLAMDWLNVYSDMRAPLTIIANKGFITTLCAAISSYLLFHFHRRNTRDDQASPYGMLPTHAVYLAASVILLFMTGFLEVNHQFHQHYPSIALWCLYLLFYTLLFIFVLKLTPVGKTFNRVMTILLLLGILIYLVSIPSSYYLQRQMLEQQVFSGHYIVHWLNALLTGTFIYLLFRSVPDIRTASMVTWLLCGIAVVFFTVEIHLIVDALFFSASNSLPEIQRVFIKTGWTILWGVCSFVFMWLGMRYKFRTLRIVSLTLFFISLLKLFFYDITDMPVGGKIAAFFSLGVLLLVVSFMYQRLKKIIIDNEEKPVD